MSPPVPTALLGVFDAQVYRCACGAWAIGTEPCSCCIELAWAALVERSDRDRAAYPAAS